MRRVVRKIDRALKDIYHLDHDLDAHKFLILDDYSDLKRISSITIAGFDGALLVNEGESWLSLGIFLNETVRRSLATLPFDHNQKWKVSHFKAFNVAVEEVSHFHCLVHHCNSGRSLSSLELELQAEIDKFVVIFFARLQFSKKPISTFDALYEKQFNSFSLSNDLTVEQKERYLEANRLAMRFLNHCRKHFYSPKNFDRALRCLRNFYRLNRSEKLSYISSHY